MTRPDRGGGRRRDSAIAFLATLSLVGRVADPEEVAAVIAFLAPDQAFYTTGQMIPVDGGTL